MIGTKLYKNKKKDMAKYTDTAVWCNGNNAHIEDKGSYYEVVENVTPKPTKEEKLAALDSQYEADKAEIMKYYVDSVIHMDVDLTNELADEMVLLDRQYKKDRAEIEKE